MTFKCIGNKPRLISTEDGTTIADTIEVADTILKQTMGLMFRGPLDEGEAMVFVFRDARRINLHMLFMRAPIDAIILDEDKKIVEAKTLRPWVDTLSGRGKYVVETRAGVVEEYELEEGDELVIE